MQPFKSSQSSTKKKSELLSLPRRPPPHEWPLWQLPHFPTSDPMPLQASVLRLILFFYLVCFPFLPYPLTPALEVYLLQEVISDP